MSASQHDQAAREHEELGGEHAVQYTPGSGDAPDDSDCAQYLGSCWASNPTEGHRDDAREHRALAARHRAASESLRQAEAAACVGLSDVDRDVSPFVHREAILRVEPLLRSDSGVYGNPEEQIGATLLMFPAEGLTVERFRRVVACHVARSASLGYTRDLAFCPLAVKGVTATVRSAGDGFAIDVSADSPEGAARVLARAQQLVAP